MNKKIDSKPYSENEHKIILDKAIALHCGGNLVQAKILYENILNIEPANAIALHLLGAIALSSGSTAIAEKLIRSAIDIDPTIVDAHNNLGTLLESSGRLEESSIHYIKALELNPEMAEIHFNLANVLRSLGKTVESYNHFKKATVSKLNFAAAYRQMASVKKYITLDDDIKEMEYTIKNPSLSDEQTMHFAFGLGKAYNDLNEVNKSFKYIALGNRLKRKSLSFKIEDWDNQVNKVIEVFNKELFENKQHTDSKENSPIFILGMPRSGTSLVEQILSSHSQVFGAGEVHVLSNSISTVTNISKLFDELSKTSPETFDEMGQKYISTMKERKNSFENKSASCFITDKMPGNFKLIGMIKLILPNSKIIHCCRNPMDNCYSIFKNYFSKGHIYAYDQVELAQYYLGYQRLMNHWNTVLPEFIYNLNYELLVKDQKQETARLLEHCDLKWENQCLEFHTSKRAVRTVSAVQVRSPINNDSISSWKKYEYHLRPLYQALLDINNISKT